MTEQQNFLRGLVRDGKCLFGCGTRVHSAQNERTTSHGWWTLEESSEQELLGVRGRVCDKCMGRQKKAKQRDKKLDVLPPSEAQREKTHYWQATAAIHIPVSTTRAQRLIAAGEYVYPQDMSHRAGLRDRRRK